MRRPFSRKQPLAAEAPAVLEGPRVPGGAEGEHQQRHVPRADPYGDSEVAIAAPEREPRLSVSEAILGGRPVHPLQLGFDPRRYPHGNPLERRERVARPVVPEVPMTPAMVAAAWEAGREDEPDLWAPEFVFP